MLRSIRAALRAQRVRNRVTELRGTVSPGSPAAVSSPASGTVPTQGPAAALSSPGPIAGAGEEEGGKPEGGGGGVLDPVPDLVAALAGFGAVLQVCMCVCVCSSSSMEWGSAQMWVCVRVCV